MYSINIEYKKTKEYPVFFKRVANKKICVAYDVHTKSYALPMVEELQKIGCVTVQVFYSDDELIPDEKACEKMKAAASNCEYLLAVGSGTLNDMAKYVSTVLNIACGVLATAPSMDGYCSKGSALMIAGKKVTYNVHMPSDVLIDADIITHAPKMMIAAGFGDIIGKYTCLLDWQLAHYTKKEPIHQRAFAQMLSAREECVSNFDALAKGDCAATVKLMDALVVAGLAMAECGNSRPASGSEHHMSHFLEMDFVSRGEKIPMHGIKVAIGTLISMEIYSYLKREKVQFEGCTEVYKLVEALPSIETIEKMLEKIGCPTRFSQIGVREETFVDMIYNAYTVRDRYTVLTLIKEIGLSDKILPIVKKYY